MNERTLNGLILVLAFLGPLVFGIWSITQEDRGILDFYVLIASFAIACGVNHVLFKR
jgi:hypothetical protein